MPELEKVERLRLFIAIALPSEVKARIRAAQDDLRRVLPDNAVSWTRPEQFHLTLRFLGNVEAARLESLRSAVRGACAGFRALRLRAAAIGFFPNPRSPRVVWVGVADEQNSLGGLHRAVRLATDDFTNERAEENFTGHVTLGRIRKVRPKEAERLAEEGRGLARTIFGNWTAKEVEIIRSQLSPQGARYSTVANVPLAAE